MASIRSRWSGSPLWRSPFRVRRSRESALAALLLGALETKKALEKIRPGDFIQQPMPGPPPTFPTPPSPTPPSAKKDVNRLSSFIINHHQIHDNISSQHRHVHQHHSPSPPQVAKTLPPARREARSAPATAPRPGRRTTPARRSRGASRAEVRLRGLRKSTCFCFPLLFS